MRMCSNKVYRNSIADSTCLAQNQAKFDPWHPLWFSEHCQELLLSTEPEVMHHQVWLQN